MHLELRNLRISLGYTLVSTSLFQRQEKEIIMQQEYKINFMGIDPFVFFVSVYKLKMKMTV